MEQLELEGIASIILREGKQEEGDLPRLAPLVVAHLGIGAIEFSPVRLPGDATLVRIHDDWKIYVRRGLPLERRAFAIAHELAEWWLRVREHYQKSEVEHAANYIGAALLAPRRAFLNARRAVGDDLPALADAFGMTETAAALRLGEVCQIPLAVVAPRTVRVRGPKEWVWPDEATLRTWARRTPFRGMRKVQLTDDPRRVVLDAEDVESA